MASMVGRLLVVGEVGPLRTAIEAGARVERLWATDWSQVPRDAVHDAALVARSQQDHPAFDGYMQRRTGAVVLLADAPGLVWSDGEDRVLVADPGQRKAVLDFLGGMLGTVFPRERERRPSVPAVVRDAEAGELRLLWGETVDLGPFGLTVRVVHGDWDGFAPSRPVEVVLFAQRPRHFPGRLARCMRADDGPYLGIELVELDPEQRRFLGNALDDATAGREPMEWNDTVELRAPVAPEPPPAWLAALLRDHSFEAWRQRLVRGRELAARRLARTWIEPEDLLLDAPPAPSVDRDRVGRPPRPPRAFHR
jgi:hypothetical protein